MFKNIFVFASFVFIFSTANAQIEKKTTLLKCHSGNDYLNLSYDITHSRFSDQKIIKLTELAQVGAQKLFFTEYSYGILEYRFRDQKLSTAFSTDGALAEISSLKIRSNQDEADLSSAMIAIETHNNQVENVGISAYDEVNMRDVFYNIRCQNETFEINRDASDLVEFIF